MRIRLENHFSQLETTKNPSFPTENFSKNVSFLVKIEREFNENKLERSRLKKDGLKKTKFGYSVLGPRKPNFITNIHFEKSQSRKL